MKIKYIIIAIFLLASCMPAQKTTYGVKAPKVPNDMQGISVTSADSSIIIIKMQ